MGWVFIHSLDICYVRLLIPPLSARTLNINTIPYHLSVDPFLFLVSLFISQLLDLFLGCIHLFSVAEINYKLTVVFLNCWDHFSVGCLKSQCILPLFWLLILFLSCCTHLSWCIFHFSLAQVKSQFVILALNCWTHSSVACLHSQWISVQYLMSQLHLQFPSCLINLPAKHLLSQLLNTVLVARPVYQWILSSFWQRMSYLSCSIHFWVAFTISQ